MYNDIERDSSRHINTSHTNGIMKIHLILYCLDIINTENADVKNHFDSKFSSVHTQNATMVIFLF